MKIRITVNELLFELYLLFSVVGIILRYIIGKWEPQYDGYTFISQGRWGTLFICISLTLLYILIFRCVLRYLRYVPKLLQILGGFIIIYYIGWSVISLRNNSFQSVFFENISTSVILLPLTFLLGYDEKLWTRLQKKLPLLGWIFSTVFFLAVVSFWAQYGLAETMNASYKNIFSCMITTMWLLFLLCADKKPFRNIYKIGLILLLIAAFITQSRAWVLQSLLFLFIVYCISGRQNKYFKIIAGGFLACVILLGISFFLPDITGRLFERGLEDTRSGQYVIFFAQYSWKQLILGAGLNATYQYLGNESYQYFDNQFMFIIFHYGILPVLYWLAVYFELFRKTDAKNPIDNTVHAAKIAGGLVLLAYLGVSTYYQIELGYNGVLIMMLFGNAIMKKQYKNKEKR